MKLKNRCDGSPQLVVISKDLLYMASVKEGLYQLIGDITHRLIIEPKLAFSSQDPLDLFMFGVVQPSLMGDIFGLLCEGTLRA